MLTDEVGEASVEVVAATSTSVDDDASHDLHQASEHERTFRGREHRAANDLEQLAALLALPRVDVPSLVQSFVGVARGVGAAEERALGSSRVGVGVLAGVTVDVLSPVRGLVVLTVHVDVSADGLDDARTPDVDGNRLLVNILDRLQLRLFHVIRILNEIGVLGGLRGEMLVAVEDNVAPEGLDSEALLSCADGLDIMDEARDEGEDVEGGDRYCASEEEIALGAVLAALVPVTTRSVNHFVAERESREVRTC